MTMFSMCERIIQKRLMNQATLAHKMDVLYLNSRLTDEEYAELTALAEAAFGTEEQDAPEQDAE